MTASSKLFVRWHNDKSNIYDDCKLKSFDGVMIAYIFWGWNKKDNRCKWAVIKKHSVSYSDPWQIGFAASIEEAKNICQLKAINMGFRFISDKRCSLL